MKKNILLRGYFLLIVLAQTSFLSGQCLSGNCENGVGSAKYLSGIYTGEFKNSLPHGKGVFKGVEYVYPDRDSLIDEGIFEAGIFVSGTRNTLDRWELFPDNENYKHFEGKYRKENGQWLILRDKTKSFGLGIGMGICEYPYPDKKKKNTFIFKEYVSGTRNLIWEGKIKKGLLHGEGIISLENNLRKKFSATFENGVLLSIDVNYWSPYWAPTINPFTLNKVEVENGMITQLMYTANGDTIIKNTSLFPFQFFCLNLEESSSGMATIKYKNNATYFGMLKIWQLHGYGEYKTVNQGSYTGYFYNGQRHGFGVTSFPNKDLDSGYYQFGQLLEGVFVLDGVSKKFPICLSGNCQDGFGKASYFVKPNDSTYNTYEGNFVNGLPNGFGIKKFSNKNYTYSKKGTFSAGQLNGDAEIIANYGVLRKLTGNFVNDTMVVGTINFDNNSSFKFDANYYFRKDFRDMAPIVFGFKNDRNIGGKGTFITPAGSVITGQFNSSNQALMLGTYSSASGIELTNFGQENDRFKYLNIWYSYDKDQLDTYVKGIVAKLEWNEQERKNAAALYASEKERDRKFAENYNNPAYFNEQYAYVTCSACNGAGYTTYVSTNGAGYYTRTSSVDNNGYASYSFTPHSSTFNCHACKGKRKQYVKTKNYFGPPR